MEIEQEGKSETNNKKKNFLKREVKAKKIYFHGGLLQEVEQHPLNNKHFLHMSAS